jgi:hypothetical protein
VGEGSQAGEEYGAELVVVVGAQDIDPERALKCFGFGVFRYKSCTSAFMAHL